MSPPGAEPAVYPAELESDVLLSDGRTAHLRPIRPSDAEALRDFGARLSPETVYFRFFSPRRALSDKEIRHFVTVDYVDRLALVALADDELVAVARYDRPRADDVAPGESRDEAEVAFVVRDDHQGRGLGTLMLEHLASAAVARGIGRFIADSLPENRRMLQVFRAAGFEEHAALESGVVRVTMELAAGPEYAERVDAREWRATVRSIERILRPASIAVIGAGRAPGSVGHELLRNLLLGDFAGTVYPVNPNAASVAGVRCYASLAEVPGSVDLAVVAVPAAEVDSVLRACGEHEVGGLVVVTAGYAELGPAGVELERALVRKARAFGMRVVGPNCMGVINTSPAVRMNATFAGGRPLPGRIGLMSQSGGLGVAILGEAARRGLGISSFVSVGNKADVSGNDLLRYWERDEETEVILLYLESFGNPRRFSPIARRVGRTKPIVAVKSARTAAGRRSVWTNSATTGPDRAVDALFRQAGVIRVDTLEELFDVADLLVHQPVPAGGRVAIVSNVAGPSVLAADACDSNGLDVPELSEATQRRLCEVVPQAAAVANPVDLVAGVDAEHCRAALEVVLADDDVDAVLAVFAPQRAASAADLVQVLDDVAAGADKPVLANLLATDRPRRSRTGAARQVPYFAYPESAARALGRVVPYGDWLRAPKGEVRELGDVEPDRARRLVEAALERAPAGADLDGPAVGGLLACYGIALDEAPPAPASDPPGGRAASAGPELAMEVSEDALFGPIVMFGVGGAAAGLIDDRAWSLVPLTDADADRLVRSLRASPVLAGDRAAGGVDLGQVSVLLSRVARLAEDLPEVVELVLDPVAATADGVAVLNARVKVAPADRAPSLWRRALR